HAHGTEVEVAASWGRYAGPLSRAIPAKVCVSGFVGTRPEDVQQRPVEPQADGSYIVAGHHQVTPYATIPEIVGLAGKQKELEHAATPLMWKYAGDGAM
ncbi:MAG TPA: hypothetical protein VGO93_30760, partial [Candidatus Xenobia bacterium]